MHEDLAQDKALSSEQLLSYARDLAEVIQAERARREALEAANAKLEEEISERKRMHDKLVESEERYRTLFEDSRDAIYITDGQGRFVDVNRSFLELLNCTKEELIGNTGEMFVNAIVWREFNKKLREEGCIKDYELKFNTQKGKTIDCLISATLNMAESGTTLTCQGIVHDITEYKLSSELLQNAKKMDALSNLAGGVAHEIRNPLAISSSAAQLLMDDDVPEGFRKDCARKIVSGIRRASAIIENLLIFARPVTEFSMTSLDIVAPVRQALNAIAGQAKEYEILLDFALDAQPLYVNGNRALLTQALTNLLMNSLAAMAETGGKLGIRIQKSGSNAVISISDTGHGISEEHIEKIFDPFFSQSLWSTGTGLGLSISYSIVSLHSGTIRATSSIGKGTTFTVSIPLASN